MVQKGRDVVCKEGLRNTSWPQATWARIWPADLWPLPKGHGPVLVHRSGPAWPEDTEGWSWSFTYGWSWSCCGIGCQVGRGGLSTKLKLVSPGSWSEAVLSHTPIHWLLCSVKRKENWKMGVRCLALLPRSSPPAPSIGKPNIVSTGKGEMFTGSGS